MLKYRRKRTREYVYAIQHDYTTINALLGCLLTGLDWRYYPDAEHRSDYDPKENLLVIEKQEKLDRLQFDDFHYIIRKKDGKILTMNPDLFKKYYRPVQEE